jgi:hypothetical protein
MVRLVGGVLVFGVLMSSGWLFFTRPDPEDPRPSAPASKAAEARRDNGREVFAADRDVVPFDGRRAMSYLEAICRIGPRISGSPGMKRQQELLQKHFESHGGKVTWQRFPARQRSQPRPVDMANLIVSWHPERERRVILCSHYDTRPIADQEPNRHKWFEPFVSANDGGSGVAFLMELAHHMKDLKPELGVDFVIFDGEEYIFDPERDVYFFGSEHFANDYEKNRPKHRYAAAILLDMIAGKNARFPIEGHSWFQANALAQQVWDIAEEQKCTAFEKRLGQEVRDDHLALNKARIPAINIIDFSYPHWHRLTDTAENCSGESLSQVARVVTVWLQRVK